jgi:UDP-N-acetylglucosamine 2-epimerase (non-hydrolysing)
MKIIISAGARPNFIKIAPLIDELDRFNNKLRSGSGIKHLLVHTGQHYDNEMSGSFFDDLALPRPDIYLGIGSGSHTEQVSRIMVRFEKVCSRERPDLVVVVGDVNSTVACALTAARLRIPVAHVEAGLRSFDRSMPEEVNRVLTDQISDYLFTTCEDANRNLKREGISEEKIHFVGNIMIDTLLKFAPLINTRNKIIGDDKEYALLTLHRPANVDNKVVFKGLLGALREISRKIPILFPAHPRTQKQIKIFRYERYFNFLNPRPAGSLNAKKTINLLNALSYTEFLGLMKGARLVLTDSGGVQEETTILKVPCLTLRDNTERPVTVKKGTNIIAGRDPDNIVKAASRALKNRAPYKKNPRYWDGRTAERIVNILAKGLK